MAILAPSEAFVVKVILWVALEHQSPPKSIDQSIIDSLSITRLADKYGARGLTPEARQAT